MDIDNEDSMDAPSVSSTDGAATPIIMSTPVSKKVNNKTITNQVQLVSYRSDLLCMKNWGTQWTIEISSNE